MTQAAAQSEIRVYWQPGCTSCLRTKEFLTRHGVPFVSRNVIGDAGAFEELEAVGLRQVPIVMRGGRHVDGQVLADVARLCGIAYGATAVLPVDELARRLDTILAGARAALRAVPATELATLLPNRPRSYAGLAYHIFNIPDAFLEHHAGIPLVFDAYNRVPPVGWGHRHLDAYGALVQARLAEWLAGPGRTCDWAHAAEVYYGRQTLHEYLERTTWHAGQHVRQLTSVVTDTLGLALTTPVGPDTWAGLPMPLDVWDPA